MNNMGNKSKMKIFHTFMKKYGTMDFVKSLCTDPEKLPFVAVHVLIWELLINIFVIQRVPYTEIDWKAYMQECEGFLNGTMDYSLLRGDTGPLVYPAGFVYIYSIFYYITSYGENLRVAQYIFLVIYLLQLMLVLRIYCKTGKVPPYVLVISILTSYRIHSIYVLRLFNDPIAVLLLYVSLNFFLSSKWTMGSIFFSLAVSVKMNILLFAPPLLLFYLSNIGYVRTAYQLFLCAAIQLILGAPFLLANPVAYLKGSFDIGRVFDHKWTVNYRFLDLELFENKFFHIGLLVLHLVLLAVFFPIAMKYFHSYVKLKYIQAQLQPQIDAKNKENKTKKLKLKPNSKKGSLKHRQQIVETAKSEPENLSVAQKDFLQSFESTLQKTAGGKPKEEVEAPKKKNEDPFYSINFDRTNQLFIFPMFLANFIGVVCARSLHYQFYSWYFHSLPYLLWCTPYSTIIKFLILALIEFSWNTYPSSVFSSSLLHACHIAVLWGIYRSTRS